MKKYFGVLIAILVAIYFAGCTTQQPVAQQPASYIDVTPAQAKELIEKTKDIVIIDLSTSYDSGHLPGAISIPISNLPKKIPELDKTKTYLMYCHGTSVSIDGATQLINAGFRSVYRLNGNYSGWVDAGYPIEK